MARARHRHQEFLIELPSTADGLSHLVREQVYGDGLASGAGLYEALCGKVVPAASMIIEPGRRCLLCIASVNADR